MNVDVAPWRIVRASAATVRALGAWLDRTAEDPQRRFAAPGGFRADDRFRLAVVVRDADALAAKARFAGKHLARENLRGMLRKRGVFVSEWIERPKVAMVFSGQGSQYPGMLRPLVEEFAPAAEAMRRCDRALESAGLPTFAEMAWERADLLDADVTRTLASLLAADTIVAESLAALGVRGDLLGGHSFGEYPALVAAGAWTLEVAAKATQARGEVFDGCDVPGGMLSSNAPPKRLEELCEETGGELHLSNLNSPIQTVVSGDRAGLTALEERLEQEGFAARRLKVSLPFHSPLLASLRGRLMGDLESLPIESPATRILSSVTGRYLTNADEIRGALVAQADEPVRYVELVERMVAEGARVLIEVGPGRVLTGLHARILCDRPDVVATASDHPQKAGLEPLLHIRACLETQGADLAR